MTGASRRLAAILLAGGCLAGPAIAPAHAHMNHTHAHDHAGESKATYLGNEGVLIAHGRTAILFDAFFAVDYNQYTLVPEDLERAIFEGKAPFDSVDAVFVSHAHGDHFTATKALGYLRARKAVRLYAPQQAVDMMREEAAADDPVLERVIGLDIAPEDEAMTLTFGDLIIEAVAIPHAGGPSRADIQNIAFRVTLNNHVSALHMGDAGPQDRYFEPHQDHWDARTTHLAMPPYWFYGSQEGRAILETRIRARATVGVHVPSRATGNGDAWREELGGDVFTDPGEVRIIPLGDHD